MPRKLERNLKNECAIPQKIHPLPEESGRILLYAYANRICKLLRRNLLAVSAIGNAYSITGTEIINSFDYAKE